MDFNKLFGKKDKGGSKGKQDKTGQTSLMLDQQIKDLELRISNLETKTNALTEEAKAKLKAGDKAGAKRILGKKKKIVDQIKQSEGAMAMMEEQKLMLDSAEQTRAMMQAIKAGNEAVKIANKGISVEDLEAMKDDMDEIKQNQEELNEFVKDYADQDQEGVDEELEQLEEQMAKEEAGAMPISNKENLGPVPAEKNNEEADLNAYLAGMAV